MPHILDISGTYTALFHLRHLASGSREFCKREQLYFEDDGYTPEEWETYQGQLHFLVSRSLILCAINYRVLQDTLKSQSAPGDLDQAEIDLALHDNLSLGEILEGAFDLTLRESCNKIIHATDFHLEFNESRTGKPARRYSYWSGFVHALGSQNKRKWAIRLDTFGWCNAIDNYVQCLSGDVEWR